MRIDLTKRPSLVDIITILSEGNPGAVAILSELSSKYHPCYCLALDACGIYGSSIYVLVKDKCEGDIDLLTGILLFSEMSKEFRARIREVASDTKGTVNFTEEELANGDHLRDSKKGSNLGDVVQLLEKTALKDSHYTPTDN